MDVEKVIKDMNRHIPVSRRTLLEYIESGDDTYVTKEGHVCSIDRKDIIMLAGRCTEIEKMRLRLPIFISTDTSAEAGAWKIEGKTEVAVVSRLLNKKPYRDDFLRLYNPDLRELRQMLPDLVVTLFLP